MKAVAVVMGMGLLLATSVLPDTAIAQPSRRGPPGGPPQGGSQPAPYGSPGGTYQGVYPAPGGYPPPGGYAPPGGYPPPGGYVAPAGYPAPSSYPPPGGYPPPAGYPPGSAPGYPPPGSASPGYPGPGYPPSSQPPFAYPQRGQSPQQVSTDQSECAGWATQQTGFNPSAPAKAAPVTATSPGESVGVFGGVTRRAERKEERWQKHGWDEQDTMAAPGTEQVPNPQQTDAYNRALGACLTARGYTVR